MKTLAILSIKGGGGRSTLATNLACQAPSALIDMDPQGTATKWASRRGKDTPGIVSATPATLSKILDAARPHVSLAVIDTPPRMEQNALAAARLADLVIIPIRPQAYDLETLTATQELLKAAGSPLARVVLNQVPFFGIRHEQARRAISGAGMTVFRTMLGNRAGFGDAAALGLSITETGYSKGRTELLNLWGEIRQLLSFQEQAA